MHLNLEDQHIFVTGGSRGIGLAIVKDLLNSGSRVSTVSTKLSDELEKLKNNYPTALNYIKINLLNPEEIKLAWNKANDIKPVTGLVNNAGVAFSSDLKSEEHNQWLSDWDKTFAINTRATAYLCKLAIETFSNSSGEES
ncbi:SDR family oxidoreductase [Mangrovivirga cuniculi]|uniref:SDR family oxidoreductase n=1 Tax=Mangrovivirga cuniculi TaxID=2715131 RepID=UPI0026A86499|nr:SDR family oxidoreductase [Mangrovivirga cuniculi]